MKNTNKDFTNQMVSDRRQNKKKQKKLLEKLAVKFPKEKGG